MDRISSCSRRLALGLGLCTLGWLSGCDYEPDRPVHVHELAESTTVQSSLAGDAAAQAQLLGALGMLFGSPANPAYAIPEQWADDERNPNVGGWDLSDERMAELKQANRTAFAEQLAQIGRGEFAAVRPPREALDLQDAWKSEVLDGYRAIQAEIELGKQTSAELDKYVASHKTDAAALFEGWYPSLRDSAELYRQQCYHCHGTSGGGNGPTARFLTPRPRDYRQGKFKWTAANNKAHPRRADIYRVLENGVNGTAMLSFKRFSPTQLEGLVDYVRLLAIRGETERLLALDYEAEAGFQFERAKEVYTDVWTKWDEAGKDVIAYAGEIPAATPERIAHGKVLFADATSANCVSCHGEGGRGEGNSIWEPDPVSGKPRIKRDDWGNELRPRDLTSGIYRGGNRPIDLFRRIYAGINGSYMPAHSTIMNPDGTRKLTDEDLWDIVHYVRSLPGANRL